MTNKEWNMGIEYLTDSQEGDWISYENRKVSVENMEGGKFLCYEKDENGYYEIVKLVETVVEAMLFLRG